LDKDKKIIKSISYDEDEIIQSILSLHCSGSIELDPTYSKGNFYKGIITEPKYKFDINPQVDGVIMANAENLPLEDNTINTIMFDPPFLATTGKSLTTNNSSNKINKRFGVYPSEKELHQFYQNALREFYRILKLNGILIFKCQDKISSGKQYLSHCFIVNEAEKIGYYAKDIFILLAKNRIVADWQLKNQKNARKYHSYFLVLEKSNKKIQYI
jgi:SAM-dependent methyltransferase